MTLAIGSAVVDCRTIPIICLTVMSVDVSVSSGSVTVSLTPIGSDVIPQCATFAYPLIEVVGPSPQSELIPNRYPTRIGRIAYPFSVVGGVSIEDTEGPLSGTVQTVYSSRQPIAQVTASMYRAFFHV